MKNRIEYIDTAKGILILTMLIGHIWNYGYVHDFIYAFHMPAFFVISGILFRYSSAIKKTFGRSIFAKFKALIIPYLFFEVFAIVLHVLQNGMILNIKGYIFEIITMRLSNGPLWFLIVLFLSEILFLLVYKVVDMEGKFGECLIIVLFVTLLFLPKFPQYINITTTIMALFFLIVGFKFYELMSEKSFVFMFVAVLITTFSAIANSGSGMPDYQDGYRVLYIIGALAGSYFILQVSSLLHCNMISFYGKNSLILLGSHYPILRLVKCFFKIEEFSVYAGLIFFIAFLLLEVPLFYVINHFFPFVIGKSYSSK